MKTFILVFFTCALISGISYTQAQQPHEIGEEVDGASYMESMTMTSETPVCKDAEDGQIYISITNNSVDSKSAPAYVEKINNDILTMAKEAGVTDVTVDSSNYGFTPMTVSGPCTLEGMEQPYQFTAGISYRIISTEQAGILFELLKDKGYNPNLNVSKYQLCQ